MATYINYGEGEDDATVQGAEWLDGIIKQRQGETEAEKFITKFKELLSEQEQMRVPDVGPVFDLFVEHSEDLFAAIPESRQEEKVKEVESFFALVLSMLTLLEDADHLDGATTRLCDLFSSDTNHPELRLRLLMMLYNTFNCPTIEFRFRVFKYILDYSAKAGLFDQVLPYLEYLDAWMVDWERHITVDDKRSLYSSISTYMRQLGKRIEAFQHLKKYHLLYQGEDSKALGKKDVVDATVQLLKDAIMLPTIIQFDDILGYDTVKALSKSKQGDLVKLCGVFLSGTVNDLRDFHGKNKKLFAEYELKFEDNLAKIRLLTLATLAHGRSEIELSEVASALEEKEENVERWVVRAISEGVIDGRIDQLNHKVLVKSSFQRKFEKEEWGFLDSKLSQWIDNLENVIKFIGEQKTLREGLVNNAS